MEFDDINKTEKQRYDIIKKSGKYIELTVLIGAKPEIFDGHTGKMPVINTCMHGCGQEEIANMYIVLKNLVDYYREQYPIECAYADVAMKCNYEGTTDISLEEDGEK